MTFAAQKPAFPARLHGSQGRSLRLCEKSDAPRIANRYILEIICAIIWRFRQKNKKHDKKGDRLSRKFQESANAFEEDERSQ